MPWPQSQALHDALRAAGVRSSLTLVDGGEHEIGSCPDDAAVRAFLGDVL